MGQQQVERFHPTGGRVPAALTLLLVGVVVVVGAADPGAVAAPVLAGAVLAGVLAWASMLRPALWVTRDHLVMQNMLETVHVPLASVEQLALRQVLAVRAGDRRYVSTVVGRPWRTSVRSRSGSDAGGVPVDGWTVAQMSYADFVEQRLHQLMQDARTAAGVLSLSDEQLALAAGVRREPAWLPIGLVVAAAVVLTATMVA